MSENKIKKLDVMSLSVAPAARVCRRHTVDLRRRREREARSRGVGRRRETNWQERSGEREYVATSAHYLECDVKR